MENIAFRASIIFKEHNFQNNITERTRPKKDSIPGSKSVYFFSFIKKIFLLKSYFSIICIKNIELFFSIRVLIPNKIYGRILYSKQDLWEDPLSIQDLWEDHLSLSRFMGGCSIPNQIYGRILFF